MQGFKDFIVLRNSEMFIVEIVSQIVWFYTAYYTYIWLLILEILLPNILSVV